MTNYDKITHILYEAHKIKPGAPAFLEDQVALAASIMDTVDDGRPIEGGVFGSFDSLTTGGIAADYVACFYNLALSESDWEDVFSFSISGYFGDDRMPVSTEALHRLEFV